MISALSGQAGVIPQPRAILPWGANQQWQMKYVVQDLGDYEAPANINGKSWTELGYNDSGWQTLTGPMSSGDPNHQHRVTNFSVFTWEGENKVFNLRRTFNLNSVNADGYTFVADFDDRIIVYINGKQVYDSQGYGFFSFHINASDCREGDNQLAITYQAGPYYNTLDYALFGGTTYNAGNYDGLGFDGLHYWINGDGETACVTGIDEGVTDPEILSSITFKNKTYPVTTINAYAFSESEMETITIPGSITTIGEGAFRHCNKLERVDITDLEAWCNIVFANGESNPLGSAGKLYLNNSRITDLVIPSSITKIKQWAFTGGKFTSLTIHNELTTISEGAFKGCSTLRTATLPIPEMPEGVEATIQLVNLTAIEKDAFCDCSALESINFTNIPSVIGEGAFARCSSLTEIELGALTTIYPLTFTGCSNLTTINIPEHIESIGEGAFGGCGKLSIDLVLPEGLTTIGNEAFAGCEKIKTLSLPNTLTTIGGSAFNGLSSIPSLYIPSSVTSIGEMAFVKLSNALSIIVDEGNTKYDSRNNCNALIETKKGKLLAGCRNSFIPDGVTSLERAAFANQPITIAILPNSVETIKQDAFSWCQNLEAIVMGSGVTDIDVAIHYHICPDIYCYATEVPLTDGDAFHWAGPLDWPRTLHVPAESIEDYRNASPWNYIPNIVPITGDELFPYTPNIDTKIGDLWYSLEHNPFTGRRGAVVIGNGESYSGDVVIPETVTYNSNEYTVTRISDRAFNGCSSLTSVTIPATVKKIGEAAFKTCSTIQTVTVSNIPAGYSLALGKDAFCDCSALTSVNFTEYVTDLGEAAFARCGSLTSVTLNGNLTAILTNTFLGCGNLVSVISKIEKPFAFGSSAFNGIASTCKLKVPHGTKDAYIAAGWTEDVFPGGIEESDDTPDMKNIEFADANVKAICVANWDTNDDGELSEAEAAAVTDLGTVFSRKYSQYSEFDEPRYFTFDELRYFTGLTSICEEAFYMSDALTSVIIPENVTSIERSAFSNCRNLRSVAIPDNVTTFGDYSFNLTGLTSVTIPSSLVSIGEDAFWGLDNLTDVWCYAEIPPSTNTNPFINSPISSATLHVPAGSLQAYRTTSPWSGFGTIVGLDEEEDVKNMELVEGVETYNNIIEHTYETITYTRTFNNTNWQALYVPFSMSYDDWKDDFEVARINAFYEYDKNEDGVVDKLVLELMPVKEGNGDLRPNYPYLIKAKTTGSKTITLTNATLYRTEQNSIDCSTVETKYTFTGTYQKMNGLKSAGCYFMSGGGLKTAASDDVNLGAFRWYMKIEDRGSSLIHPSEIKLRMVDEEDDLTEIEELEDVLSGSDEGWCTLDGVQLMSQPTVKGLYLHKGKKIFIQ